MTAAGAASVTAEVISLPDERASIRRRLLQRSARKLGEEAFARAGAAHAAAGQRELAPRVAAAAYDDLYAEALAAPIAVPASTR